MLFEKYRPKKLDEIVGQERIIKSLKVMVRKNEFPHMLFVGPPGCGKTSTAYAFANELGISVIEYNASDDRRINVVRERIKRVAFSAGRRIILLDEADNMTSDAQHALRRIMEKCGENRFILTANEEWKIIDAIKSRCAIYYFEKLSDKDIMKIIAKILKGENVKLQLTDNVKKALLELIRFSNGDLRRIINILESMITSGRELTVANIKLYEKGLGYAVIKTALSGNWKDSLMMLRDMYSKGKLNPTGIVEELYDAVNQIDDDLVKAKLFISLADVERAIKIGCNPLIQLSGFLAKVWAVNYVPKG